MALQTGPDANTLLTTALEKLLYLESRLEASEAAREDATRERDRQRDLALRTRRSLDDWQRRAADAQVAAEGAEREVALLRGSLSETRAALQAAPDERELRVRLAEAEDRLSRFAREREAWLDRMVALGRLRSADDELDLGAFIAELRQELLALRRGDDATRVRATLANIPPPPDARALLDQAPAPELDPERLAHEACLPRPEKTLALLCARDLASDSALVRRRAAERLVEAGLPSLNPWVVQRLAVEPDPHVRASFVRLLDRTGGEGASVALERALGDADPRVRALALEALAGRGVLPPLGATDPSPAVRRRALTSLPRDGAALDRLAEARRDDDPSVRHVALRVLGGRSGPEAVALLQAAAGSSDPVVAQLARQSLARRGLPLAVPATEETPAFTATYEASEAPHDDIPLARLAEPPPEPTPEQAPPESSPASAPEADPLEEAVLDEIRTALRGRTVEELVALLGRPLEAVGAATARLVGEGRLLWRGRKLYQP
jgi:hypothetical protein